MTHDNVTLLEQGQAGWLNTLTTATRNERTNVLEQVAACAFYARYNVNDSKKELYNHYVTLGYTRKLRDTLVISQTKRNYVDAALVLVEKEAPAIRDILAGVAPTAEGRAEAVQSLVTMIFTNYTAGDDKPLNIGGNFLPMLMKEWSKADCLEVLEGKDKQEATATAGEGEGAEGGTTATAKEEKEEKPHSEKVWNAAKALFALLSDIPAKDAEAQKAAVEVLHTAAAAVMTAEGVYTITRQSDGMEISLGFADMPIAEGIAKEYSRATSGMAAIKGDAKRADILAGIAALEEKHAKPEKKSKKAA